MKMHASIRERLHKGISMQRFTTRRRSTYRSLALVIFLAGVSTLIAYSCAFQDSAMKADKGAVVKKEVREPTVFQSDDYVICRLEGGETAFSLAERFLGDAEKSWVIEDANKGIPFESNQVIVIPLKEINKGGLTVDGYQVVPILCYHRFAEKCKSSLCIPAHIFDQQMKYLKDNHYRVITLSDLLDFLRYRHSLPRRSVVITIDDGYRSAYDIAYPILKRYGFCATLLVYIDYVGISGSAVTWDQLREMKADGFEVGSQTVSHCDLTKKREGEDDKAYMARIKRELLVSKQIIDKELDQETIYLAYPYSNYDQRIVHLSHQVGYKIGLSVKRGSNAFFSDPLTLKRDLIVKKDMETFITRLTSFKKFPLH
jgi:peptidoglycan/xylan/chitin deacetylase (PgdA/CDA1 family)